MKKDELLTYINEIDIFEKYLNIDIEVGKLFINPLRNDINPTCMFYYANHDNRLRWTDFAGFTSTFMNGKTYKSWDCFDTVQYIINLSGGLQIPFGNSIINIKCNLCHSYSFIQQIC